MKETIKNNMKKYSFLNKQGYLTMEGKKLYRREELILHVAECIAELMKKKGISNVALARKMETTRGYITQLLNGQNMTLKTVSDTFIALDARVVINVEEI